MAEATARANADSAEVTARTNAINAAITGEASARSAADATLTTALATHAARTDNPHTVTKAQVGLGSVDNTADAAKPVSAAQLAADAIVAANSTAPGTRAPASATPPAVTVATFQTGHGFFASGTGATITADTSAFLVGVQSLRLTTGGTAAASYAKKNSISPAIDMRGKQVRVWVRLPTLGDIANIANIGLFLGNDNNMTVNFAQYFASGFGGEILGAEDGWWGFVVNFGDMIATGSPDRSAISALWLRVTDANGQPVSVQFGKIELLPEPPSGAVTFWFDDGRLTQYTTARPILNKHGFPATYSVIRDIIVGEAANPSGAFSPAAMSMAQLRDLQDLDGSDIACHANTIAAHNQTNGLVDCTPTQLEDEFTQQQQWLRANGFRGGEHFAYPKGRHNQAVYDAVRRHFRSARSTYRFSPCETWPPTAPLKLKTKYIFASTTFAEVQAEITRARLNNEWLILTIHDVVASPTIDATEMSTTIFGQIVDECAAQGIAVRTASDVFQNGMLGTAASAVSFTPGGTVSATNVQAAVAEVAAEADARFLAVESSSGAAALKAANLSDLASVATARANLGLGSAATSSTADFETAATAVLKSLADAKGDLFVGSADNTVIRKAVGANDTVLTADSTAAGGVKWAAAVAGASLSATQSFTGMNTFTGPGAQFVDADVGASARTFAISPRVGDAGSNAFTFPVVAVYPTTAAKRLAFDIMPSAGAAQDSSNGVCWLDVCGSNVVNASTGAGAAVSTARIGIFTNHVEFGSRGFGGAPNLDIWIAPGSTGASTPSIFVDGITSLVNIFSKTSQANTMMTVVAPAAGYLPAAVVGVTSQSADLFAAFLTLNGTRAWSIGPTGIPKWGNSNGQTTVGAAGGASALPLTPSRYLKVVGDDGTSYVIPAYAAA